jgi:hypothetical protein
MRSFAVAIGMVATGASSIAYASAIAPGTVTVVVGSVLGDPWGGRANCPAGLSGKVAYTFMGSAPEYDNYLVVRDVRNPAAGGDNCITYKVTGGNKLGRMFDPQFSPDGRHVLVKIGAYGTSYMSHVMYVMDLKTSRLRMLTAGREPLRLLFLPMSWSPDGKFLAFVAHLDDEGGPDPTQTKPELITYSLLTGAPYVVSRNIEVRYSFDWLAPHTLLYSSLSPSGGIGAGATVLSRVPIDPNQLPPLKQHPDLYAVSAEGGAAQRVSPDAYRATASPDGKWIAFFGSENPARPLPLFYDWEWNPRGSVALAVASMGGLRRKALNREEVNYPDVLWGPIHTLFTLKESGFSPDGSAVVKAWNIETGRFRLVATLTAKDIEPVSRIIVQPQFRGLAVAPTRTGACIIVRVTEMVGLQGMTYDARTSLVAVDASTGLVSTVARVETAFGVDWWTEPDGSQKK